MKPETLEELRDLIGEKNLPKKQKQLDWLLKYARYKVERKGEDWLRKKKNLKFFLRQWNYVARGLPVISMLLDLPCLSKSKHYFWINARKCTLVS